MSSLGLRRVARLRWRWPEANCSRSHQGANCCQNVSTEQYRSSILIYNEYRSSILIYNASRRDWRVVLRTASYPG